MEILSEVLKFRMASLLIHSRKKQTVLLDSKKIKTIGRGKLSTDHMFLITSTSLTIPN